MGSRVKMLRLPKIASALPYVRGWPATSLSCFGVSAVRRASLTAAQSRSLCVSSARYSLPSQDEISCLHRQRSYWCEPFHQPLLNLTFGDCIDRSVDLAKDQLLYTFFEEGKRVTFSQHRDMVHQCAKGLLDMGLKRGDSLLIMAPNCANWLVLFGACAKIGVISASIHPSCTQQELFGALNRISATAIFSLSHYKNYSFYEKLCHWIPELADSTPGHLKTSRVPSLKYVIVDSEKLLPGTVNMSDILKGSNVNVEASQELIGSDDPLTVIFTSGTTGPSKAACITHHGFVNIGNFFHQIASKTSMDIYNPIILNPLPFFHVFGLMVASLPLFSGDQVVFPCIAYDHLAVMKAIQEFKCTEMCGSPTMYVDLINHSERAKYDLSSLRYCIMGGAYCTPEVRQTVEKELNCSVLVGYGATETSTASTVMRRDDPVEKRLHTVGRPIPYVEIKIADLETGLEVPFGQPGEVCVRGFNIFSGYIGEPEKTNEVITPSRWYRTGDLGTMDSEGYVDIVGRIKDIVIRGGENIHPVDIEVALNTHVAVDQSYIIGVPDKRMGEEVCAVVILKKGATASAEDLREFLKEKIAYFKIPKYFIFEDDIPKTAIGKAQKNKMREVAIKKLGL